MADMDDLIDAAAASAAAEAATTAPVWYWVVLVVIAGVSFWAQATVTEERFVPALNVIANEYNIPSDIAGATLMAAGASSPELFSSFVSLFITHSALGLGTIVGSEIFNQLIICAGAVFASRSGKLQLDKAIVAREVGFYGLSIALLYIALHDRHPADDDELDDDHIFISFLDACILFGGYLAYVAVCAKMDTIVALFSGEATTTSLAKADAKKQFYGAVNQRSKRASFNLPDAPFLREAFGDEPESNFSDDTKETMSRTPTGTALDQQGSFGSISESLRKFSDGRSLRNFLVSVRHEKPSDEHALHDIEFNGKEGRLSCFMWQRSLFYNKARFGRNMWHLRWFSFTKDKIKSCPDRAEFKKRGLKYPKFTQFEFDDKRHIIRIPNPPHCKRKEFYFMAPSEEVFTAVVDRMDALVRHWEDQPTEEGVSETNSDGLEQEAEFDNSDPHVDLTEFPSDGSTFEMLLFLILYPFRFLMQWTIGDVRTLDEEGNPTATRGKAFLASFMCLVWLVVGSYTMVASLENLAELMDVPDAVVGVTVAAAGTSLPNYVASKVAAQNGFGNMAVSNAFGSNTFNIMVGLGLPWMLYIASTGLHPYHALHDDGITMSVIILGTVLAIFLMLVIPTGFVLYRWHGTLFICMYIAYLAFAIGQVYL